MPGDGESLQNSIGVTEALVSKLQPQHRPHALLQIGREGAFPQLYRRDRGRGNQELIQGRSLITDSIARLASCMFYREVPTCVAYVR